MEIKKGDPIAWYCSYRPSDEHENVPKQYVLADYGTVIRCNMHGVTIKWVGLNGGGEYTETHNITEYDEVNFRYDRAEARNRTINEILK